MHELVAALTHDEVRQHDPIGLAQVGRELDSIDCAHIALDAQVWVGADQGDVRDDGRRRVSRHK
jgi:hypothetical protein